MCTRTLTNSNILIDFKSKHFYDKQGSVVQLVVNTNTKTVLNLFNHMIKSSHNVIKGNHMTKM